MLPSELSPRPFFILDNGLNPDIARMMSRFDYPIRCVQDEFGDAKGAIKDEEIIEHIARTCGFRGVWVTKDVSAKRAHLELIKARRISVVWIQRQALSSQQQHRIITYGFARVFQDLVESDDPLHYLVKFHGAKNREWITYTVEWRGKAAAGL